MICHCRCDLFSFVLKPAHEPKESVSGRDDCFFREDDGGSSPDGDGDNEDDD